MSANRHKKAAHKGFTLVQVSLILSVAALAMVAVLPSTQTNLTAANNTSAKMNTILIALRTYQAQYGELPCPADASLPIGNANYGVKAANTNCQGGTPQANFWDNTNNVAIGMVPIRSLNLPNDYAVDAWGHDITYAVDTTATNCWTSRALTGNIIVTDNVYTNGGVSYGSKVNTVAALISHGPDGHGAWLPLPGSTGTATRLNVGSTDTDEHLVNAHGIAGGTFPANHSNISTIIATAEKEGDGSTTISSTFVRKPSTTNFDDIVVYKNGQWNLNQLPSYTGYPTVSSYPANGTYVLGQTLPFTITYPASTTVTGSPYLGITVGSSSTPKATYASGSPGTSLLFNYTVGLTDFSSGGLVLSSGITLNGGTMTPAPLSNCLLSPNLSYVQVTPPSGVVVDASGHCAASANCIDFADTLNSRFTQWSVGTPPTSYKAFGSYGTGNNNFEYPSGITQDTTALHNLWVLDSYNHRVTKWAYNAGAWSSSGNFGTYGTGANQFNYPMLGIAADSTPNIWLSDTGNNRFQKCSASGSCTAYGTGTYDGKALSNPTGLALDVAGNVWVADTSNNRVLQFTSAGAYNSVGIGAGYGTAGVKGASGTLSGQFLGPTGIAIDTGTTCSGGPCIWVVDTGNNRVQGFSTAGTYSTMFGPTIGAGYMMVNPTGIAVDTVNSKLYVTNSSGQGFSIWSIAAPPTVVAGSSGVGSFGTSSGSFNF